MIGDEKLLLIAFFFVFIIERLLEFVKCVYDFLESKYRWEDYWDRKSTRIRNKILARFNSTTHLVNYSYVLYDLSWNYITEHYPGYEGSEVISSDWVRRHTIKGVAILLGVIIGIMVAWGVQLDAFSFVAKSTQSATIAEWGIFTLSTQDKEWLGYTVTGIALGLGAGPLHAVIAALERVMANRQTD